ncbi:hypothetical protein RJ640_001509 [Escallonia rubra]|uniref:Uncharacterized protein n=1 Tax=Escallonia rubra TaxID=112253 RepID=A0AA88UKK0_9ASTE|nr:hypothetical protein RJ640_001509 [Escallonia rubra]
MAASKVRSALFAFSKVVYTANKDKQYRVFKEEVRSLALEVAAKHLAKSSSADQLLGFTASVVHIKTSDGYELMAKSVNLVSTFMYTDDASGRVMYESSACITAILPQVEHNLEHTRTKDRLNIYGCIMDDKVWEHPEEWRPERFLDENNDSVDLYKMTAFGGGKRGHGDSQD